MKGNFPFFFFLTFLIFTCDVLYFVFHNSFLASYIVENSSAIPILTPLSLVFASTPPHPQILNTSSHHRHSDILNEISWSGFFYLAVFWVSTNLEKYDSFPWEIILYYHNKHFYLSFISVILSVNSIIILQMSCFFNPALIHHSLIFHFNILEISWSLVYNSVTKGPLISVLKFHGVKMETQIQYASI